MYGQDFSAVCKTGCSSYTFFPQTHSLNLHLKSDVNFDMVPAPQEAAVFQAI